MKFYDCKTAPSARLVRIFMAEKGINIPFVEVDLRHAQHLSPEFRVINPYCTVPVLELDDGRRLASTRGCWRYLEEIVPEPPLLGSTAAGKAMVADRLWRIETDGFQAVTEAFRNAAPGLKNRALTGAENHAQIAALAARGRRRTERFFLHLEDLLTQSDYLVGDEFSAADIMALTTVDFAGWLKIGLPEQAVHARRWYESVSARPSAKR